MGKKIKLTKEAKLNFLKNVIMVVVGCAIYSFGIGVFLDPYRMAAGGVTGISILINAATGDRIGTGWLILIINVPLFIIGLIFIGKKFVLSSLLVVGLSSGMMEISANFIVPYMPKVNIIVAALAGGTMFGAGLGLVFRTGSSTGGTDIIVKLLRRKFRYLKTGIISVSIDCLIVMASTIVYKDLELMLVTIVSLVTFSIVFNRVLYGGNSAMKVIIITTAERARLICDGLLKDLDVGATIIDGKGAYSGSERTIIMCAVKNYVYPRIRDVVKKYDSSAFTIVSSALEIYGEGYLPQDAAEL